MASPWKFLARLVSPRRQQKEDSAIVDVKPDVLAIAGPAETAVESGLHIADQPAAEQLQLLDRPDARPAGVGQSGETRTDARLNREGELANAGPVSDPDLLDVGTITATVEATAEAEPVKRRARAKKIGASAVVSKVSPTVPSASDDMVSLDEEIAVLRAQLAAKLQLQNAQLKKMLARFES
jgi:hypothetical protein